MTELEQFAADSDATPPWIVLRHLQNQLLELGIETWPTRAAATTEGRPPSPHQLAMPTQNRLRLDKHPDQNRTAHPLAQRRHDRPIRRIQLRPLDLTAYDAKLVPEHLAQGVSPRVVMEILGHSQISLTMNTYTHVLPELRQDAADRMSDLIRGEGR